MKRYVVLSILLLGLFSCGISDETVNVIENKKVPILLENNNCEICNTQLWTKTGVLIGKDNQEDFKKEIDIIDKKINIDGHIGFDDIIRKARYLEYIGQVGQAIKLYEENFYKGENKTSIVYNHNMAKLYETVGSYDLALARYEYLIIDHKRNDYLRDVSIVYEMIGNEKKSKQAMDTYKKLFKNSNGNDIGIDIGVE